MQKNKSREWEINRSDKFYVFSELEYVELCLSKFINLSIIYAARNELFKKG